MKLPQGYFLIIRSVVHIMANTFKLYAGEYHNLIELARAMRVFTSHVYRVGEGTR